MNVGPAELIIILLIVAVPGIAIWAAIDAAVVPERAFRAAGQSKPLWIILPLVLLPVFGIGGFVAGLIWFFGVRPRVVAHR